MQVTESITIEQLYSFLYDAIEFPEKLEIKQRNLKISISVMADSHHDRLFDVANAQERLHQILNDPQRVELNKKIIALMKDKNHGKV